MNLEKTRPNRFTTKEQENLKQPKVKDSLARHYKEQMG